MGLVVFAFVRPVEEITYTLHVADDEIRFVHRLFVYMLPSYIRDVHTCVLGGTETESRIEKNGGHSARITANCPRNQWLVATSFST